MLPTPLALYQQLGALAASMPDLYEGPITPEMNQWLGRAVALVNYVGTKADIISLKVACQNLNGPLRLVNSQTIAAIVHQALAIAELAAPAESQGAFITAGSSFDAFAAVGKVLGKAKSDVLLVDPYADEKALTDFAVLAPDGVAVRLLADAEFRKPSLKPAGDRWRQQFKENRPLEVRLAAARTLHDRLILVDGETAWVVGQSFNKLAERAHTSIVRMDDDSGRLKIGAYAMIWESASVLT